MLSGIARGLGRLAVFTATMALLTAVTLMVGGAYLMTWPLLRKSPRDQRIKAAADLATASMAILAVFFPSDNQRGANDETHS